MTSKYLKCDRCPATFTVMEPIMAGNMLTSYAVWDGRDTRAAALAVGWQVARPTGIGLPDVGQDLCPDCRQHERREGDRQ